MIIITTLDLKVPTITSQDWHFCIATDPKMASHQHTVDKQHGVIKKWFCALHNTSEDSVYGIVCCIFHSTCATNSLLISWTASVVSDLDIRKTFACCKSKGFVPAENLFWHCISVRITRLSGILEFDWSIAAFYSERMLYIDN